MIFKDLSKLPALFPYFCFMTGSFFTINRIFFFFSMAILGVVLLPYWLSPGMFFDGVTYAAVAKNWSQGAGEFWIPFYHHRDEPFTAHPPLLYSLLGSLYILLGDAWWVEEIYNFLTYLASIMISVAVFQKISLNDRLFGFLPLLLLVITPLYSWAFRSTLLDNTVTVFALLAVYAWLNFVLTYRFYFLAAGIIFVISGFMVKGPPALFPLMFLPVYTILFHRNSLKSWVVSFTPLVFTGIILLAIILFNSKAANFFEAYFTKQVLGSIQGIETINNGRFYLLQKLLLELTPMGVLTGVFTVIGRKKKQSFSFQWVTLFLMIAIAASLPLLISQKQRAFYLVPSLPFFAIAFSLIIEPYVTSFCQSVKPNAIKVSGIVVFLVALFAVASSFVTRSFLSKDAEVINDMRQISTVVKPRSTLRCSSNTAVNWKMVAYAARYGGYTLDDQSDANYYLCIRGEKPDSLLQWEQVDIALTVCKLYKKREPEGSLLPRSE